MNFLKKLFRRRVKLNLDYPTSWEEMTPAQFHDVCTILSLNGAGRERTLFLCLCKLTGIRPDNPNNYKGKKIPKGYTPYIYKGKTYFMSATDIAEAGNGLAYIYDAVGLPPSPLEDVDQQIGNISFQQFFIADSYILRYQTDNNPAWLKEAAKALTNGRKRKLLNWERIGLVVWWNGVKEKLKQQYPFVFRAGSGSSDKTQAEILQDLLSCVNGGKPQANDSILKTDVHSVLYAINKKYADANQRLSR